jgi:hypothetical protein
VHRYSRELLRQGSTLYISRVFALMWKCGCWLSVGIVICPTHLLVGSRRKANIKKEKKGVQRFLRRKPICFGFILFAGCTRGIPARRCAKNRPDILLPLPPPEGPSCVIARVVGGFDGFFGACVSPGANGDKVSSAVVADQMPSNGLPPAVEQRPSPSAPLRESG